MYGKVKLSKKQIKEDKFTTFMLTAKQQFTDAWQYYAIGFVVVILIVSAVVFFQDMQESQAKEAADVYAQGVVEYRQTNYQNALLTLERVINEFGGTEPALMATYMMGKTNLMTRNYPEAQRYFEMYISKKSSDKLRTAASYAGIATGLENQGKYAEAGAQFVAATKVDENGPLVGDYHFSAMRNFLAAADFAAAQIEYDYILENYATTNIETRAKLLFAEKKK